ncbi:MAG: LUD domain-containing protein [Bacteroidetes bacterium]|nr:LUD domain-containing protein [Bacteroidota bacterium]MDA0897801.1 LUD domain-containing protein [Bacteroidota bacterium]
MEKSFGFLSKLKSSLLGKSERTEEVAAGKFAPKQEEPLDVKFVQTFTEGGGNFIYCTSSQEAVHALEQYARDHQWRGVYISSPAIVDWSNHTKLDTTFENDGQYTAVLSTCEALIAFNGGIMIHSHHTGGRKLGDLPKHHIIIAHTSQIVPNLRDGLTAINQKYRDNRPSNIAVIRAPHDQAVELASADPNKGRTVFLILIEDEA